MSPEVVIECTGVAELIRMSVEVVAPDGVVCLAGVGSQTDRTAGLESRLATAAVVGNLVIFGFVNADCRRCYGSQGTRQRGLGLAEGW
jgi:threonine dehydrogenase-like Zn-dependent dehydrogenase